MGVIGPQCSGRALAVLPIYADAGIVAISGSATLSELADEQPAGHFFFRTAYRNDTQGILFRVYVSDPDFLEADDAYIVDDSEPYGRGLADDIERELLSVEELSGGEARVRVTRASIEPGAVDFSDLAAEIARADPDVVIFAGRNPEAGLLLRQLRDAGWGGSYATGDDVCGGPGCDFLVSLGALAEGAAFSGCSPPLPATFVDAFEAVHDDSDPDDDDGRPTAAFVAHYADAATILLDAVAAVAQSQADGSLRVDPTLLRGVVAASLLSGGLSGNVAFDSSGDRRLIGEVEGLEHVARDLGLVPCFVENGTIAFFEE